MRRTLVALVLFGIAFGYVEAAVVVYLRHIEGPARARAFPDRSPDDVLPLLSPEAWKAAGINPAPLIATELGRELATMFMLVAIALAHARSARQWFAGFMISFGVWDIFYYVFLKVLLGWPASLMTWDILFLLPVPWTGPVITPVLVAAAMIVFGALILAREESGQPARLDALSRLLLVAGGLIVIVAFCWEWRRVADCQRPQAFNWPLFIAGNAVGLAGALRSLVSARTAREPGRSSISTAKAMH